MIPGLIPQKDGSFALSIELPEARLNAEVLKVLGLLAAHVRCLECRKVEEFTDERIKQIEEYVSQEFGYRLTGLRFELLGYCPDFLKKHLGS